MRVTSMASCALGFSVPSTKPMRSRLSKKWNPCTSSTGEIAVPSRGHDSRRQLEAQIHPLRTDMEEHVARCWDGVTLPGADLMELVQFCRRRLPEESIP